MMQENEKIQELIKNHKKYLDYLFQVMVENKVSDMFLTYDESPCFRINWSIHRFSKLPKLSNDTLEGIAYIIMNEFEWEIFRDKLTIDLWTEHNWNRFRVNISMQQKHIMIVIRLLASKIPTIDELWLPPIFKEIVSKKSWIILLAWPTGSWKSTTLASMIEEINNNYSKHIITIEDPIEYIFTPKKSVIEQKQLGEDITSFWSALKSALRQNPDVVLFWEMRDFDSIKNAITLAETWHLVLSTIHSRSSSQTVSKIIDVFSPEQQSQIRIQLAEALLAVISQRLINKKDGTWMAVAFEIMINNNGIANLIIENQIKQINNIIQTNKTNGMILLEDGIINLIDKWDINMQDWLANANNTSYIMSELRNRGINIFN